MATVPDLTFSKAGADKLGALMSALDAIPHRASCSCVTCGRCAKPRASIMHRADPYPFTIDGHAFAARGECDCHVARVRRAVVDVLEHREPE